MWDKRKPKILIVEDDKNNHQLFHDAYEQVGFEVIICISAERPFVEEVVEQAPDIISMDLMIGKEGVVVERDGFDALKLLKEDNRTRNIPVIIVSNFTNEEKLHKASALGAIDYFNLQGQSITQMAKRFKEYVDAPKKYKPSHPMFRS